MVIKFYPIVMPFFKAKDFLVEIFNFSTVSHVKFKKFTLEIQHLFTSSSFSTLSCFRGVEKALPS